MSQELRDEVQKALSYISPHERRQWVLMAFAVKQGLGEAGWGVWNEWSKQSPSYKPGSAKSVWRSAKAGGRVTVRTLFKLAREAGYEGRVNPQYIPAKPAEGKEPDLEQQYARVAGKAQFMFKNSVVQRGHPYMVRKGFPEVPMHVWNELLLIPLRPLGEYRKISSLQIIDAEGRKKYLRGGRVSGCVFQLGAGRERWWCEGLCTGLSINEALRGLRRRASVIVCFSAGNLKKMAKGGFVVADNDASGTGEQVARATGLRWWMPPERGDANDFHLEHGLLALEQELLKFVSRAQG